MQPHPSRLFYDGRQYVLKPGAYARPECNPRARKRAVAPPPLQMPDHEHEQEHGHDHEQEQEQGEQQGRIRGWAMQDW